MTTPSDRRPKRQRTRPDPIARELGQGQADVLQALWRREHGATVPEIHDAVNAIRRRRRQPELAYTTILTNVQRLHARGLLGRHAEGRGFRYVPTLGRDALLATWSDELIDRLLGDFGEIAIARLDERLRGLDDERRARLASERGRGA